jgi:hypothetical protein
MSTQVQFRRGNTQQISAFTGALAEIIVDTDLKTLTIQDGVTPGGWYLASKAFTQAAFDAANNAGSSTTVTNAYNQANAALVLAQAAYNLANTDATLSYVQDVYRIANNASALANTIYDLIDPEFSEAANNIIRLNDLVTTANTRAYNSVLKTGDTMTGDLVINSNTVSTSNGSGSLLVSGGVGVTGNVSVSGYLNLSNTAGGQGGHIIFNQEESSIDFMIF